MKKMLALALTLMLMLGCVPVLAQSFEDLYDGAWVQFDGGFEVYLPSDWMEVEITEEEREMGFFYGACSPDASLLMEMAWAPLETEVTLEQLCEIISANSPAQMLEVNGIGLICTADTSTNTVYFIGLDGVDLGYYTFLFSPVTDEETKLYTAMIAASLRNLQ